MPNPENEIQSKMTRESVAGFFRECAVVFLLAASDKITLAEHTDLLIAFAIVLTGINTIYTLNNLKKTREL